MLNLVVDALCSVYLLSIPIDHRFLDWLTVGAEKELSSQLAKRTPVVISSRKVKLTLPLVNVQLDSEDTSTRG